MKILNAFGGRDDDCAWAKGVCRRDWGEERDEEFGDVSGSGRIGVLRKRERNRRDEEMWRDLVSGEIRGYVARE